MQTPLSSVRRWPVIGLLIAAIVAWSVHVIGPREVRDDAAQNLQMAMNVAHHGVMSLSETSPYEPTMYREPVPVAVGALMVALSDRLLGPADPSTFFSGARVQFIKYQNIAWLLFLTAVTLASIGILTGSFFLAVIGTCAAISPFFSPSEIIGIDDLYTELPGTGLLVLACLCLIVALRERRSWMFLASGLAFGLAALTKGVILYVFAGVVLCVILFGLSSSMGRRRMLWQAASMVVGCSILVGPWLARNASLFGQTQISERGGLALYTRALMNEMSAEQYRGAFYAWARPALRPLVGSLLGFTPEDLGAGGPLQRFAGSRDAASFDADVAAERDAKPELAITDYRRARAERKRLTRQYEHDGAPHPDVAADATLARQGMRMIEHHIADDVALAVPLLWRSAALYFPLLCLGTIYAFRSRNEALAAFLVAALVYLGFYALMTPFDARPAVLARPAAVTALLMLLQAAWHAATGARARAGVGATAAQTP